MVSYPLQTGSNFLAVPDFDIVEPDFDGIHVEPEPKPIDLPGITPLEARDPDNLSLLTRLTKDAAAPFMYIDPSLQATMATGFAPLGKVEKDPQVMPAPLLIKRNADPNNSIPSAVAEVIPNIFLGERAHDRILNDAPNVIPQEALKSIENVLLGQKHDMLLQTPFTIGKTIAEVFTDEPVRNLVQHPEAINTPAEVRGPAVHGHMTYNPARLTGYDMAPETYMNPQPVVGRSLNDLYVQPQIEEPKYTGTHNINTSLMDKLAPMFHI